MKDINLKDNVSQFMEIEKVKTTINRAKLLEYVDVNFSELSPITFTHLLEKYNKFKKDIPFYRYRTEDFFNEYSNSNIPIAYRIQKFFEEFERIKLQIPAGSLQGISSEEVINELGLFGYGTMTYLMKEARVTLGDGNVLEWSTNQVLNFINEIDALKSEKIILDAVVGKYTSEALPLGEEASGLKLEIELLQNALASATASDLVPSDDPTEIITEVTPPGFVQESTYFSDMGYVDLNEDTLVDIEDVKLSLQSDIVVPTIQTPDEIIQGCTDSTATNYNVNALIDDGSCVYAVGEPTPVFNASFDDWQDAYSPSNYWFRSNVGVIVQTDGPDGIGDGAMRIYRTALNGEWPGAMYNPGSKSPRTIPEFNIEDRVADHLYLQEGRTYKIGLWGRCNTTDKNAMVFIGDTRGGNSSNNWNYSWQKSGTWATNNNWTYYETTFSPVKNAFSTSPTDFKFEYWEYPGGVSPSWGSRLTEEPIAVEEHSKVNYGTDWSSDNIAAGKSDNILLEINGYINLPSTGTYTFDISVDDGVYLWVDSETVISSWVDGAQRTETGTKEITTSGAHKIKIRYYEHVGSARLKLYVKGPGISGDAGGFISPSGVSNPTYEPFAGVMANMYLYPGTNNGGSPGQYCDYANVKIEELVSQTTQMRLGGRICHI